MPVDETLLVDDPGAPAGFDESLLVDGPEDDESLFADSPLIEGGPSTRAVPINVDLGYYYGVKPPKPKEDLLPTDAYEPVRAQVQQTGMSPAEVDQFRELVSEQANKVLFSVPPETVQALMDPGAGISRLAPKFTRGVAESVAEATKVTPELLVSLPYYSVPIVGPSVLTAESALGAWEGIKQTARGISAGDPTEIGRGLGTVGVSSAIGLPAFFHAKSSLFGKQGKLNAPSYAEVRAAENVPPMPVPPPLDVLRPPELGPRSRLSLEAEAEKQAARMAAAAERARPATGEAPPVGAEPPDLARVPKIVPWTPSADLSPMEAKRRNSELLGDLVLARKDVPVTLVEAVRGRNESPSLEGVGWEQTGDVWKYNGVMGPPTGEPNAISIRQAEAAVRGLPEQPGVDVGQVPAPEGAQRIPPGGVRPPGSPEGAQPAAAPRTGEVPLAPAPMDRLVELDAADLGQRWFEITKGEFVPATGRVYRAGDRLNEAQLREAGYEPPAITPPAAEGPQPAKVPASSLEEGAAPPVQPVPADVARGVTTLPKEVTPDAEVQKAGQKAGQEAVAKPFGAESLRTEFGYTPEQADAVASVLEKAFGIDRERVLVAKGGKPSEQALLSTKSWGETDKAQVREDLKKVGYTDQQAQTVVADVEEVARAIAQNADVLDFDPVRAASSIKDNADPYYGVSLDFSTICRKAAKVVATVTEVQKKLGRPLEQSEWLDVRKSLLDKGDIVSCLACYVFSRKIKLKTALDKIQRYYPDVPKAIWSDPLKHYQLSRYKTPEWAYSEMAKESGVAIDKIRKSIPDAGAFLRTRGSGVGKAFEPRTDYRREILDFSPEEVERMNKVSGMRKQSWSDFEPVHLLDHMQATIDASIKGLASHSYTKEPNYVDLAAPTGEAVNMSLIPKGSGLDAKGRLVFDDVEGMPIADALAKRKKHRMAGTVLIGANDAHIVAAMADPRIDYIIPYHASGLAKEVSRGRGLAEWVNYEGRKDATQHETVVNEAKFRRYMAWKEKQGMLADQKEPRPWEYWDKTKSGDENAANYLAWVEVNGMAPKFAAFADKPGYWKVLVDRRMYDENGKFVEQGPLKPTWDKKEINRILTGVVEGEIPATGDYTSNKEVVKETVKAIREGNKESAGEAKATQTITSAETSLPQVPALFKSPVFEPKGINLDIGAGKFDLGTKYLKSERGVTSVPFDPFNLSPEKNRLVIDQIKAGKRFDTVTAANVLNVINSEEGINNTVLQAAKAVKPGGAAYFQIYEGDGSGVGKTTTKGWQNNRKTAAYLDNVGKYFDQVERKGNFIVAKNPKAGIPNAKWRAQEGPIYGLFQGAKGSVEFLKDGKALIRALDSPDVSTGVHEIAHVGRRFLLDRSIAPEKRLGITDEHIRVAEEWSGAKDGVWTRAAEEKFARGFEKYLSDGQAPTPLLADLFAKLKEWLSAIYTQIAGSAIDLKISPEMRGVYDALVSRGEKGAEISAGARTAPAPAEPGLVGMGGAVPSEFAPQYKGAIGIKNAAVEALRAERGLPPIMAPARLSNPEVWDRAMAKIESDPGWQDRLIAELKEKPRNLSAEEEVALDHEYVSLYNERYRAIKDLDQIEKDNRWDALKDGADRAQFWEDKLTELETIARRVGTEWGRSGQMRQRLMLEDYTLEAMEGRMRVAKGGRPLDATERAKINDLSSKINDAMAKAQAAEAEAAHKASIRAYEDEVARLTKELAARPRYHPQILKLAENLAKSLDEQTKSAADTLRQQLADIPDDVPIVLYQGAEAPPRRLSLKLLAEVGAARMARTGGDKAAWSELMVSEFGEKIRPHLDAVWGPAQAFLDKALTKQAGTRKEQVRKAIDRNDVKAVREQTRGKIKTKVERAKADNLERREMLKSLSPQLRALAKTYVEEGLRDREVLLDAVHEDALKLLPDITRRETMDGISGYGEFKPLDMAETNKVLRDLKGQYQNLAKLEDLKTKGTYEKTGVQRRIPSDIERQLIQQVNEAKREYAPDVVLESRKKYYRHRIADLEEQIASGERIVETKTPSTTDPELEALIKKRDELRKEFDEIFGTKTATEAQRIAAATKAVEKSIADYDNRIRTKNLFPDRPKNTPVTSPELELLRNKRDALKAELQTLKDADVAYVEAKRLERLRTEFEKFLKQQEGAPGKPKIPDTPLVTEMRQRLADLKRPYVEAKQIQQALSTVQASFEEYARRINEGDLSVKEKKPGAPVPEELARWREARDQLKSLYEQMRQAAKPAKDPDLIALNLAKKRVMDRIVDYQRRLVEEDFSPRSRPRRDISPDDELLKLKADEQKWKEEWESALRVKQHEQLGTMAKTYANAKEVLNQGRNLLTAWDLSGLGRQGGFQLFSHPVRTAKSIKPMLEAFKSEDAARLEEQRILSRPNAKAGLYDKAGLYLSPLREARLSLQEEAKMSRLAPKVWGVRASNRAYITVLNRIRADSFDAMVKALDHTPTQVELEALGNFINVATGRGDLGKAAVYGQGLATLFFAPRLVVSRFQLLTGQPLRRGTWATRKLIAQDYARYVVGLAAFYALAQMAGAQVNFDTRTGTYGKAMFGQTAVDPMSGLAQVNMLLGKIWHGERITQKGERVVLRGKKPFRGESLYDVGARFARTKFSPPVGALVDIVTGENVMGEPVTPKSQFFNMVQPLSTRDFISIMEEQGIARGTAIELLNIFGITAQYYGK